MSLKIGVFDSGLGGLSVVRCLLEREPDASVIYVADTDHVPYGGREAEEVRSFALGITQFLIQQDAGAILMACNMSSAVALDAARNRWPDFSISGVIHAGAKAAAKAGDGPIGVLATAGTVASGGYLRALEYTSPGRRVVQTACPEFVPLIEAGELTGSLVERAVREYLQPGLEAGVRTFILGCTHYPYLLPVLKENAPKGTIFIDPAEEAVVELQEALGSHIACGEPSRYILTRPAETFRPIGSRFMNRQLPELELAVWENDRLVIAAETPALSTDRNR